MTVDKAKLLKSRLPEAVVDVEGVGEVRVRGLSRAEVLGLRDGDMGTTEFECQMVSLGMVAPKLTVEEVERWQQAAPAGEMEPVTNKISELSALNRGVAKEAWKEFESDPDAEFRALPGRAAGHDGGPAGG